MKRIARKIVSFGLWPTLVVSCLAVVGVGMGTDYGFVYFNGAYLCLAFTLFFAERLMPYEKSWVQSDGQIVADLSHTALNKGAVQIMVAVGATFGVAETFASPTGNGLWPSHWPMIFQVGLGLVLVEVGLYAAHRLAHEWSGLWRFHAVHHSSKRLSFINTGRFHVVDTAASIVLSQPILFAIGAPIEVFKWVSAFTAFVGMLTHCNVDVRLGWLSYVFNTPILHRFHHSKDLSEGNKNYGENLVFMDQLFGTYHNKPYRPSADIGINDPMPEDFVGQVIEPFRRKKPSEPDIDQAAYPSNS